MKQFKNYFLVFCALATLPLCISAMQGGYTNDPRLAIALEKPGEGFDKNLWRAITRGNVQGVKALLLVKKPNLDAKDFHTGNTVLHTAAQEGNSEIVQLLLEAGAKPNVTGPLEETPLHSAAETTSASNLSPNHLAVVQMLINAKANVNAKDRQGATPLHQAAEELAYLQFSKAPRAAIIKALLQAGAERHHQLLPLSGATAGYTPLHHAADADNQLAVQELLIFEPKLEELRNAVSEIIKVAMRKGLPRDIRYLLQTHATQAFIDHSVDQSLEKAKKYAAMEAKGKTAADLARDGGYTEVAQMLDLENPESLTALRMATRQRINELLTAKKAQIESSSKGAS